MAPVTMIMVRSSVSNDTPMTLALNFIGSSRCYRWIHGPRDPRRRRSSTRRRACCRSRERRADHARRGARRPGSRRRRIYRLFGDKDGLIDAVAEHVMATYVAAKSRAAASPDPVADLRAGWRMHVDFGLANPELYALLNRRGPHSPATVAGIEVLRAARAAARGGRAAAGRRGARAGADPRRGHRAPCSRCSPPRPSSATPAWPTPCSTPSWPRSSSTPPPPAPAGPAAVAIQFATLIDELPALSDAERALLGEWVARAIAAMSLALARGPSSP